MVGKSRSTLLVKEIKAQKGLFYFKKPKSS